MTPALPTLKVFPMPKLTLLKHMLPYLETEAPSPDEIPFFALLVLLFLLFVLPMYVPPFSYLLPLITLSMLTDFKAFAPFYTSQAAMLFPIACKSYPVTCV